MTITTFGIDIAKSVFQLHGIDADGGGVMQRKLRRGAVLDCLDKLEPCLQPFIVTRVALLGFE